MESKQGSQELRLCESELLECVAEIKAKRDRLLDELYATHVRIGEEEEEKRSKRSYIGSPSSSRLDASPVISDIEKNSRPTGGDVYRKVEGETGNVSSIGGEQANQVPVGGIGEASKEGQATDAAVVLATTPPFSPQAVTRSTDIEVGSDFVDAEGSVRKSENSREVADAAKKEEEKDREEEEGGAEDMHPHSDMNDGEGGSILELADRLSVTTVEEGESVEGGAKQENKTSGRQNAMVDVAAVVGSGMSGRSTMSTIAGEESGESAPALEEKTLHESAAKPSISQPSLSQSAGQSKLYAAAEADVRVVEQKAQKLAPIPLSSSSQRGSMNTQTGEGRTVGHVSIPGSSYSRSDDESVSRRPGRQGEHSTTESPSISSSMASSLSPEALAASKKYGFRVTASAVESYMGNSSPASARPTPPRLGSGSSPGHANSFTMRTSVSSPSSARPALARSSTIGGNSGMSEAAAEARRKAAAEKAFFEEDPVMRQLKSVFEGFAMFGIRNRGKKDVKDLKAAQVQGVVTMDNVKFAKFSRDTKLVGRFLSPTDVDLIFMRVKKKGDRKITFRQFCNALRLIADKHRITFDELASRLVEGKVEARPTLNVKEVPTIREQEDITPDDIDSRTLKKYRSFRQKEDPFDDEYFPSPSAASGGGHPVILGGSVYEGSDTHSIVSGTSASGSAGLHQWYDHSAHHEEKGGRLSPTSSSILASPPSSTFGGSGYEGKVEDVLGRRERERRTSVFNRLTDPSTFTGMHYHRHADKGGK
uniref:Calmodulin n=1 Tax=Palpitomonas bilix TaxID=652834 RepID=A0A7S3GGF1_9EUKA|mmetsp:Transcript_47985/g.124606  ORF Transcript_47985/g.124606 Transcript_47985/m.124606 type:complete len:764 (+) Transcript_47985:144-2435(+)